MSRYLPVCMAILCGAILGCQETVIRAEAPGSQEPLASKADVEGDYGLYHVTQFNDWGQPVEFKLLTTYHLQAGDPLGFEWSVDKANINAPDAHLSLEAYAGDHRQELGAITSMVEKYYWCNTAAWDTRWHEQPGLATFKAFTLQN
jgi:hypothetical protein